MKSFADYFGNGGTGPAAGKMFSLYGMQIGNFVGMENGTMNLTFIHPVNGRMDVPMHAEMPIPINIEGQELKGPILNPVLKDIILVD